jgi:glycolate oxidase
MMSNTVHAEQATPATAHRLPRDVYAGLEAIVGPAHVSEDDHVLASHDWFGLGADPSARTLLGKPPGAVVLPASTEEVAAIVKLCHRHGIKFKAHSTGYGNMAGVGTPGSVSIDLRRMNRLEIDVENRMAVIEPYVTAGQLMSAVLKHNLMCHIIGAGPSHSPLASATSMCGVGTSGNHTGNNGRNLLSLEWVSPEGEIVRIGSAASGAGWFTGEGPGPGFRGMLRGVMGTQGGLGVFTRIGYKLYPWAGPPRLEWTGPHPQRGMRVPERFALHHVVFDRWEDMAEATHHLHASKVATIFARTPPAGLAAMCTPTTREHFEAYAAKHLPDIATAQNEKNWSIVLMAWSDEELQWKQAVLDAIIQRTRARKLPLPPEIEEQTFANLLTSVYVARFMRMGSGATISLGVLDSSALLPKAIEVCYEAMGDQLRPGGKLLESDSDHNWMWATEGRHFWTENNPTANRMDPKSLAAMVEFVLRSWLIGEKKPVGMSVFLQGPVADLFGPAIGHPNRWMRRVKNLWDPKDLSDSKWFTTAKPDAMAKFWPVLKNTLFRPRFRAALRALMAKQFAK